MKKNKNKDKRKKRGFRIFLVILFFTVLIGFIFLLLGAYVFETKIKTIVVHDNNILTDEEIIALAELENYPNFYLTTSSSIEKNIEKSDFIEKVEVKKNLFFEVDIYVTENVLYDIITMAVSLIIINCCNFLLLKFFIFLLYFIE